MIVKSFTVNPFQENTYICHDGGEAVVIDPGFSTAYERQDAVNYLTNNNLVIRHLLLTHGHIDHIIDCAYWADSTGLAFAMHAEDVPLLVAAQQQAMMFGVRMKDPPEPGRLLAEEDRISIGNSTWEIRHAPGHSPGSICFVDHENRFVIGGDVLFAGSIGRTDLWKGSMSVLLDSIHKKLLTLPDEMTVYPGHGPATTIGRERDSNPFLHES